MQKQPNPKSRTALILTLITAGVFLIGAALIPLLVRGQQNALATAVIDRPPVVMNQTAPSVPLTDLQGNPVTLSMTRGENRAVEQLGYLVPTLPG